MFDGCVIQGRFYGWRNIRRISLVYHCREYRNFWFYFIENALNNFVYNKYLFIRKVLWEKIFKYFKGHETTAMSLTTLMFNLALNQDCQKLCRAEVDNILDNLDDPENLSLGDINDMKYLDRCVKENLRMFPILPGFGRELTSTLKISDDMELDAGLIVCLAPWVIHRNPKYYPNPTKFDPDRFLPENCKKRHAYAYLPFSMGPRNCVKASYEINYIIHLISFIFNF